MNLKGIFEGFMDFLFPKDPKVHVMEALSPEELHTKLPKSADSIALFQYQDPYVRELIWEIKYRANKKLLLSGAALLYAKIPKIPSLLVPMPMSDKRRLERGWNQTELICEEIKKLDAENLLQYSPDILKKVRHTESQAQTETRDERLRNLNDSMESFDVVDKTIILIDDVFTTGATFSEAKRALEKAGAKKVVCLALAH